MEKVANMMGELPNETDEARTMVLALVQGTEADCREVAMTAVGRRIGLSRWAVWALAYGRRKTIGHTTMQALRRAYLDLCHRQILKLEAQLHAAEMRGDGDDFRIWVARLAAWFRGLGKRENARSPERHDDEADPVEQFTRGPR